MSSSGGAEWGASIGGVGTVAGGRKRSRELIHSTATDDEDDERNQRDNGADKATTFLHNGDQGSAATKVGGKRERKFSGSPPITPTEKQPPTITWPTQVVTSTHKRTATREMAMRYGLPQRWLYCPPMGKVIANKFLPMKTPLAECYDEMVEERYRFHPDDVFRHHPDGSRVGLWLDFTNTERYYNRADVEAGGLVRYVKLPLRGHGETPSEADVQAFIDCVKKFFDDISKLKSNKPSEKPRNLVAMHCTHGFNRTGFLIAAYLFKEECYGIDTAVEEFRQARPKGIYKQDYLDELWRRYGDHDDVDEEEEDSGGTNRVLRSRGPPEWESVPIADEDYYFGGYPVGYTPRTTRPQQSQHQLAALSHGAHAVASTAAGGANGGSGGGGSGGGPRFVDGRVPAVTYVESAEERAFAQEKVREMLHYGGRGFAGSQPVSLEGPHGNNNIQMLAQNDYMVSWKADGVRYLVLIVGEEQIYAFDRDNNVFRIPGISFPSAEDPSRHVCDTLLDAELVIDEFEAKGGGPNLEVPRLLIYDIMRLDGVNVGQEAYRLRFDLIRRALIDPRVAAMKAGRIVREHECMGIRRKDFWPLAQTPKLFEPQFLSNLHHGMDGLVFQPCNVPYTPGKCEQLLKWKPPDQCTVDFRLDLRRDEAKPGELRTYCYELSVLHLQQPFSRIPAKRELLQYNGKIVECSFDHATRQWVVMRERTDKSFPNAYETAMSVWNTIRYPITNKHLVDFIGAIGR